MVYAYAYSCLLIKISIKIEKIMEIYSSKKYNRVDIMFYMLSNIFLIYLSLYRKR